MAMADQPVNQAAEHARNGDLAWFQANPAAARHVSAHDEDGRTLLHHASSTGNAELVSLLLANGGDAAVNVQDDEVR